MLNFDEQRMWVHVILNELEQIPLADRHDVLKEALVVVYYEMADEYEDEKD